MMSLDEAIQHCEEKACNNTECSKEHKQLAEWLKELKKLKELAKNEYNMVKEVDLDKEAELIANGIMISVQSNKYGTNVYNTERNDFNHHHLQMAARKGIELGLKAKHQLVNMETKTSIAKKFLDAIIYDNDYVNIHTPFDESKHYGGYIEKVAETIVFPNNDENFFTDDVIDLFAVGDYDEKMRIISKYPELEKLDSVLDEYYDYLNETFKIQ